MNTDILEIAEDLGYEIVYDFENNLKSLGVTVLRNQAVTLEKNGELWYA